MFSVRSINLLMCIAFEICLFNHSVRSYLQVIHQKYRISYDEITNDLCPVSHQHLHLAKHTIK